MDWVHGILDGVGVLDPTGIADGLNGIAYVLEGDSVNAGISFLAAAHIGEGLKAAKYARKAADAVTPIVDDAVHQVTKNRAMGLAGEQARRKQLEADGYTVEDGDWFDTPYGRRKHDIKATKEGKAHFEEVKTGSGARYRRKQRVKDEWLYTHLNIEVRLTRMP